MAHVFVPMNKKHLSIEGSHEGCFISLSKRVACIMMLLWYSIMWTVSNFTLAIYSWWAVPAQFAGNVNIFQNFDLK